MAAQLNVGLILARRFTLCALGNFVDVLRLAADEGDRSRPILCAWRVLSPGAEDGPRAVAFVGGEPQHVDEVAERAEREAAREDEADVELGHL